MEVKEVVLLRETGLVTQDEARKLLGLDSEESSTLAEAERVLRVISGWNPDRVTTADAIKPALDYFDVKAACQC